MWRSVVVFLGLVACKSPSRLDGDIAAPANAFGGYCHQLGMFGEVRLAGPQTSPVRPTNTFSIVARDPATGDLGVAVQSHWFSVGSVVTWAEPGVGAVATQSFVEPSYGPKGLALMREGMSASDAMTKLLGEDKDAQTRQLGFVDATGHAASHTGNRCIEVAGSHVGDGYAVQANIMANDLVVPAMSHAFESSKGDLADRLLAALDAAQEVGGDIRGCQSAAILIVSGNRADKPWQHKVDLRVEDHPAPLAELRRLVGLARAYDQMNRGDELSTRGDFAGAATAYATAATISPDNTEMAFWAGVAWASKGDFARSSPLLRQAFREDPAWIELVRRLPAAKLLPDAATAEKAISEAQK